MSNIVSTALFEMAPRLQTSVGKRDRKPRFTISKGSVTVKGYGPKSGPFTIAWREHAGGARKRAMRSDLVKAKKFAEDKATALANGETNRLAFSQADIASFIRAREILLPTGKPLELAAAEYAELIQLLNGYATPREAITAFLRARPAGVTLKNIPELVTDLLAIKKQDGISDRWYRTLKQQLTKFSDHFTGPLQSVNAAQLNTWLRSLKGGLRTRKNYRGAITELVTFAQAENLLPRDWLEMKRVDDPKVPPVEARIYTPEQMMRLLTYALPNLRPFLALQAFAGIRHEEMSSRKDVLVSWENINLKTGVIRVSKLSGKTGKGRRIVMSPNLIAWLKPYAKPTGRICELKGTTNALNRLSKRSGITWVRNASRKSFISHRVAQTDNLHLTSREAGNSVKVINDNYLELVPKEQGERWFNIWPAADDKVIQIQFPFGEQVVRKSPSKEKDESLNPYDEEYFFPGL